MKAVVLIGAGAIGCRHLQACALLPAEHYTVTVVEPADDRWVAAQGAWQQVAADRLAPALNRVRAIDDLPQAAIDVAVVATQAGVRAVVTQSLLEQRQVRNLVLEKVLFQHLRDYPAIAALLVKKNIPCWVNCARRMWPAYSLLKAQLADREIAAITVTGHDWDIGCNGIHFLDLCAFLLGGDDVRDGRAVLDPPRPAKRPGLLHLTGRFEAEIQPAIAAPAPIVIESVPGAAGPMRITLQLRDGEVIRIEEGATTVSWTGTAGMKGSGAITFQSRLTNALVEQIAAGDPVKLASYGSSRRLHEAMLGAFATALRRFDPAIEQDFCPVT